ncbi:YfbM family protein [Zooshikella harenae]|uniref:YfbM family protein n=1 Tax=Zooshikella harenae TaxID=2827238 RepID=A0ABS5ZGC2_9GAMM|nr:YfbM family protein [Zooshikella harenae]MBU2713054.1 YfbM family protein [Zooshikella harenae]
MCMNAYFRRMSPGAIHKLLNSPEWLPRVIFTECDKTTLDIDKSWHIIHYLLCGSAQTTDELISETILGGRPLSMDNLGCGPARYFEPLKVAMLADELAPIETEQLMHHYSVGKLSRAGIYAKLSDTAEDRSYISCNFDSLKSFYMTAAHNREGVITVII